MVHRFGLLRAALFSQGTYRDYKMKEAVVDDTKVRPIDCVKHFCSWNEQILVNDRKECIDIFEISCEDNQFLRIKQQCLRSAESYVKYLVYYT